MDQYKIADELWEEQEELAEEFPTKAEFGSRQRKRNALKKEKYKLKRASKSPYYPAGVYPVDEDGRYTDLENAYRLKRVYRGRRSSYIKKLCNRKFRRNNDFVTNQKGIQHKATEFWWEYI